jgi:hypothetical protein
MINISSKPQVSGQNTKIAQFTKSASEVQKKSSIDAYISRAGAIVSV